MWLGVLITIAYQGKFQWLWLLCSCKFCECNFVSPALFCSFSQHFLVQSWVLKNGIILKCRDISNNRLSGDIPVNGSFSLFTPIRFSFVFLALFLMDLSQWTTNCLEVIYSFANNNLTDLPEPPPTSTSPTPPPPSGFHFVPSIFFSVFLVGYFTFFSFQLPSLFLSLMVECCMAFSHLA